MRRLCLVVSFITSCVVHHVVSSYDRTYLFVICDICAIQIFVQTRDKEQKTFVIFVHGTCARANMGVGFVHPSNLEECTNHLHLCTNLTSGQ